MTFEMPKLLDRRSLAALLASPPQDYEACNLLSRKLHNWLPHKNRARIEIGPGDLLSVLARVPQQEEQEIHRLLKMFLVMFVISRKEDEVFSGASPSLEGIAAGRGAAADTARYFLKETERAGETPHLHFFEAAVAYKSGQVSRAFAAFDQARRLFDKGWSAYHHQVGAHSIRPVPEFLGAAGQGHEPSADFAFDGARRFSADLPVIAIGVDQGYYDRYAPRWIKAAEGVANLHFHVANPDPARLHSGDNLRYSFETVKTPSPAYFATMRFLHLHRLLERYQVPVIVSDADAFLSGDPSILIKAACQQDLACTVSAGFRDCLPWRHLIAQAVMARPTDGAFRFLACFRSLYCHVASGPQGPQWWIDQALLAATLAVLREQGREPAVLCGRILPAAGLKQGKL